MAHDGKLLARAREALEQDRAANQAELQRRTAQIYHEIPQIEQIDNLLRGHMAELVRLTISRQPDLSERLEALKEANLDLQMRRAELLTEHGYPIEYLDEIVTCPECRDTGYKDGNLCVCMERRYNRELTKDLSALLRNGNESLSMHSLVKLKECLPPLFRQFSRYFTEPVPPRRYRPRQDLSVRLHRPRSCRKRLFGLL